MNTVLYTLLGHEELAPVRFVLLTVVQVTVLVGAAELFCRLRFGAAAARRHLVLGLALCGSCLLPGIALVLPPVATLPIPIEMSAPATQGDPGVVTRTQRSDPGPVRWTDPDGSDSVSSELPVVPAHTNSTLPGLLARLGTVALAVWLAGACRVLLDLIAGLIGVRHLAARSRPFPRERLLKALPSDSSHRLRGVRVACAAVASPVTFGCFRSWILLPEAAVTWDVLRLRVALLHELAHIERRDWTLFLVARVASLLYWFHPLVRATVRRLHREAELSCDDRVLREGLDPADYAREIVQAARSLKGSGRARIPAGALGMNGSADLSARVDRILAPSPDRSPNRRSHRLAFGGGFALLLAGLIILQPTLTRADRRAPSPRSSLAPALQARWETAGATTGLFLRGVVTVNAAGSRIESLTPGGLFLLATRDRFTGTVRRLLVTENGRGSLSRSFAVQARPARFDRDAAAWLEKHLVQALDRVQPISNELRGIAGGEEAPPATDRFTSSSVLYGVPGTTRNPNTGTRLGRIPSGTDGSEAVGFFLNADLSELDLAAIEPGPGEESWLVLFSEQRSSPFLRLLEVSWEASPGDDPQLLYSEDGEPRAFTGERQEWARSAGHRIVRWHGP